MAKKKSIKKKGKGKHKKSKGKKWKSLRVKGTLSKKELKKAEKALAKISTIPSVAEAQNGCNHQHGKHKDGVMTVAEFKELGHTVLNGRVDDYVRVFGEENVSVCRCFTPIVSEEVINETKFGIDDLAIVNEAMKNVVVGQMDSAKDVRKWSKGLNEMNENLGGLRRKYKKVCKKIAKREGKSGGHGNNYQKGSNRTDFSKIGN